MEIVYSDIFFVVVDFGYSKVFWFVFDFGN